MRKILYNHSVFFDDKSTNSIIYELYDVVKNIQGIESDIREILFFSLDFYNTNLYFPSIDVIKESFNEFEFIDEKFDNLEDFLFYIKEKRTFYIHAEYKYASKQQMISETIEDREKWLGIAADMLSCLKNVDDIKIKEVSEYDVEESLKSYKGKGIGPPTNIEELDEIIGGLLPKKIFGIAAPPKSGKTRQGINMNYVGLMNYNDENNTLVYTLELPKKEWFWKLIWRHGYYFNLEPEIDKLLKGQLTEDEENKVYEIARDFIKKKKSDLIILELSKIDFSSFISFKTQMKNIIIARNIKTVIFDYLQIMKNMRIQDGKDYLTDMQLMNKIVLIFHEITQETDARIILLIQINRRGLEKAEGKKSKNGKNIDKGRFSMFHLAEVNNLERFLYYCMTLYWDDDLKKSHQIMFQLLLNRDGPTLTKPCCTTAIPKYFLFGKNKEMTLNVMNEFDEKIDGFDEYDIDIFEMFGE